LIEVAFAVFRSNAGAAWASVSSVVKVETDSFQVAAATSAWKSASNLQDTQAWYLVRRQGSYGVSVWDGGLKGLGRDLLFDAASSQLMESSRLRYGHVLPLARPQESFPKLKSKHLLEQ
jgi:hypothetical protein